MKFAMSFLLVFIFFIPLHSQINQTDSMALVDLYHSLDGDNWDDNDHWLTDQPVDQWFGVRTRNNRVDRLLLSNNGLSGIIPESINDMDALTELYFGADDISMPLPDMSELVNLERLYLFDINMDTTFPAVIRPLSKLKYLNLGQCQLRGSIPSWLPELSGLERLELSTNDLEGDFMSVLWNMPQLKTINIFGNNFSGQLPDFSIFRDIEELTVGNNNFTGSFPEWVTELDSLRYLHLGLCYLSGELPDNLFSRMSQKLRQFVLTGNNFEGDIQNALDAFMPNLFRFEIANNDFTGYIPDDVMDINIVKRWAISNNDLSGIPDFMGLNLEMTWFYSSNNKLGFDELEPCLNITGPSPNRVTLGPQKPLLDIERLYPDPGDMIKLNSGSGGQFSHYQWYKDSLPIPGASEEDFMIDSYSAEHDGEYYCVITNDSFEFDLVRNPVYIGNIVHTNNPQEIDLSIYPNPNDGAFTLSTDQQLDLVTVYDLSGRKVRQIRPGSNEVRLSGFGSGTYFIHATGSKGSGTTQIVVNRPRND